MTVKLAYENLAAQDLERRGLCPETAPTAILLVDIEADLTIRDEDRVVMAEGLFPVAELARGLVGWLRGSAVTAVRKDVVALGAEPGLIPEL
ncbi:hypothetical protein [Streptomyces sp. NPDC001340]